MYSGKRMKKRVLRLFFPALTIVSLGACSTGGSSSPSDASTSQDTGPALSAESCSGGVMGTVETSIGTIGYANGTMQGEAKHLIQDGCLTEIHLRFTRDEGCQLDLTLQSVDSNWTLVAGNLSIDEKCALSDAEGSYGVYSMNIAEAVGALVGEARDRQWG